MGISFHKIKKWTNMLLGKSVYHVNQGIGKVYSKTETSGYYNDLSEKVTRFGVDTEQVPLTVVDTGESIYFSIAIFQYGLGAYDLYLQTKEQAMLDKVLACADWAVENQQEDGSWVTFAYENPEHPYSSMAQGEGISLLLRAYLKTNNERYLVAAQKAKEFMLLPIEQGGTTRYMDDEVYLYECTHDPLILNGWIFSIWGLWDYCKCIEDVETQAVLTATLKTLESKLPDFDMKYWSKYEDGKRICSPFYHRLHIAQLRVMYDLTETEIYKAYADRWEKNEKNSFYKAMAFLTKAMQKIME